ncbi:MAG TPA: hypothetical protein VF173_24760 [Thermoanaerobaculia bacterium]|nr:hypothetical protein [Thermoanaerobaculia bacterium]
MCPQARPTQEDLDRLMRKVRPKIAALFAARSVPEEEAERLVGEALTSIAYRWPRVHDRAGWVLKALDKKTRSQPEMPETAEEENAP